MSDLNTLLSGMRWNDGDALTELGSQLVMTYEKDKKQWVASGNTAGVVISPQKSYAIKVKEDCKFPIGGTVITDEKVRTIKPEAGMERYWLHADHQSARGDGTERLLRPGRGW